MAPRLIQGRGVEIARRSSSRAETASLCAIVHEVSDRGTVGPAGDGATPPKAL